MIYIKVITILRLYGGGNNNAQSLRGPREFLLYCVAWYYRSEQSWDPNKQ